MLEQPWCGGCLSRLRRNPADCPGCGQLRVLAFYDTARQAVCAACAGRERVYACRRCGREDHPYGRHTCGRCVLNDRLRELLDDGTGRVCQRLQPVFDTLLAGPRPQTTLGWLARSRATPILRQMARGERPITHATFDDLPADKAMNYLRDLLVAVGVLEPYDAPVERITPWLTQLLDPLPHPQRDTVERFARWHVLRRLRAASRTGTATQKAAENARATILAALRFTSWLAERGLELQTMTQPDLEDYLTTFPTRACTVTTFLTWTRRGGLTAALDLPSPRHPLPAVTLSDQDRWRYVEQLLHDDTIRTYVRVAGLLTLLFAQPLTRICRMRADQVSVHPDDRVSVRFDTLDIELPDPLDQLLRDQLERRGQASYVSRADTWLFPGGIPGRHLVTENIRSQLVERGIHPNSARKAALFALAAEIPTPILADTLGLSRNTATRWATLAARDWSQYTAERREYTPDQ